MATLVLAGDGESSIQTILKIDRGGEGHATAVAALKELSQEPTDALLPILHGMDRANPLAANWLRGAFQTIADRGSKQNATLPLQELEQFVLDRTHAAAARKLAFDWLVLLDPLAADRLVPTMIDDPGAELRRESVQRLIDQAIEASEAGQAAESKQLFQRAFAVALDPDQLDRLAQSLTDLGEKPDMQRQLGLLDDWWLIGPFDHRGGVGFDAIYPPEREVRLQADYAGLDQQVAWFRKESGHPRAVMDLNRLVAPLRGAVFYAYREFNAAQPQSVEIRLGTPNGWKLWVNGELVFAREEYHHTMQMDQYRLATRFVTGTNRILLKICQNEQKQEWAQRWQFQMRVCDSSGAAVLPTPSQPETAPSVESR